MSSPAQNWRKLPRQTIPAGVDVTKVLDAIHAAFTSATYYNGAARIPGAGSAWTAAREQILGTTEATWLTPPVGALNHRVIFAGQVVLAKAPTMDLDATGHNFLFHGMAKNCGAY